MITNDKITKIFCIIDEFDKNLNEELKNNLRLPSQHSSGKRRRNISCMDLRRTWRTNSCRLKKRLCSGKDISSSALTSCLKARLILCIHVIVLYTTSSWTSARLLLRIASSTTSLMRCLCMWKSQDNLNCLNCNLIPNWRIYQDYCRPTRCRQTGRGSLLPCLCTMIMSWLSAMKLWFC